jgi:hypothetical protein
MFWALYKGGRNVLNPNYNAMKHAPVEVKFLATVILACFWCLAFGLTVGDYMNIAPNMLGHLALLIMTFVTWHTFRWFRSRYTVPVTPPLMRDPQRQQRDYELTDQERELASKKNIKDRHGNH